MAERNVIGRKNCHDCGAVVEVRVDKSGGVYTACDGRADDRLCSASLKYSKPTSRHMIAAEEACQNGDMQGHKNFLPLSYQEKNPAGDDLKKQEVIQNVQTERDENTKEPRGNDDFL